MRLGGGLLVLGHFLAKLAFRWFVDCPRHVMDAPVEDEFSMFLGLRFAVLGRDLLPCLVFPLLALVRRVLLVLRGPFLTSVLALFASPGDLRQLGWGPA
jgi:hypothetical protein